MDRFIVILRTNKETILFSYEILSLGLSLSPINLLLFLVVNWQSISSLISREP